MELSYWQSRYTEYVEAENHPSVKKHRERKNKKSAKKRGAERGLTVQDGGKS